MTVFPLSLRRQQKGQEVSSLGRPPTHLSILEASHDILLSIYACRTIWAGFIINIGFQEMGASFRNIDADMPKFDVRELAGPAGSAFSGKALIIR